MINEIFRKILFLLKLPFLVLSNIIRRKASRSKLFVSFLSVCPSWVFGLIKVKTVSIEVSSACNLQCVFCPVGNHDIKPALLSLGDHNRMVDLLPTSVRLIQYNNRGEPTMNPDFPKMVRYSHEKGLLTLLTSNGTLLHQCADQLAESGLDLILISIDGTTQEIQAKYRIGSDLQIILDNLKMLIEARKNSQRKSPRQICVQMIVSKHNEHQREEMRQIVREMGVDRIYYKTLSVNFKNRYVQGKPLQDSFMASDPRHRRKYDLLICPGECRVSILANGDLIHCEQDVDAVNRIGNLLEAGDFNRLYYSRQANEMKKKVLTKQFPLCQQCSVLGDFWIPDLCESFSDPLVFELQKQLKLPL